MELGGGARLEARELREVLARAGGADVEPPRAVGGGERPAIGRCERRLREG